MLLSFNYEKHIGRKEVHKDRAVLTTTSAIHQHKAMHFAAQNLK
jgi:hypothetical protein